MDNRNLKLIISVRAENRDAEKSCEVSRTLYGPHFYSDKVNDQFTEITSEALRAVGVSSHIEFVVG